MKCKISHFGHARNDQGDSRIDKGLRSNFSQKRKTVSSQICPNPQITKTVTLCQEINSSFSR
jgi:hypothetical protein